MTGKWADPCMCVCVCASREGRPDRALWRTESAGGRGPGIGDPREIAYPGTDRQIRSPLAATANTVTARRRRRYVIIVVFDLQAYVFLAFSQFLPLSLWYDAKKTDHYYVTRVPPGKSH